MPLLVKQIIPVSRYCEEGGLCLWYSYLYFVVYGVFVNRGVSSVVVRVCVKFLCKVDLNGTVHRLATLKTQNHTYRHSECARAIAVLLRYRPRGI